jgi:hypothetical protein
MFSQLSGVSSELVGNNPCKAPLRAARASVPARSYLFERALVLEGIAPRNPRRKSSERKGHGRDHEDCRPGDGTMCQGPVQEIRPDTSMRSCSFLKPVINPGQPRSRGLEPSHLIGDCFRVLLTPDIGRMNGTVCGFNSFIKTLIEK